MAIFAVGDIQGCLGELRATLREAGFKIGTDTLWCVGDLVNRGPHSLDTLRFIQDLGERTVCVLGNHDITLLALAAGVPIRNHHQLQEVLDSPERDTLVEWLRHLPVLHHDPELNTVMVHAGVFPQWGLAQAHVHAAELQEFLRHPQWNQQIQHLYGAGPRRWKPKRKGYKRIRFICNSFTRMRYLDGKGRLNLECKQSPQKCPKNLTPWFKAPKRRTRNVRIVFGHWATLGLHNEDNVWGIDTGCVWGGKMSVLRLSPKKLKLFQMPCPRVTPSPETLR